MLPNLPNRDNIKKDQTISFAGINRNPAAVDGTIKYTVNMGSDRMPFLCPRKRRFTIGQYSNCNGIYAYDGLWMVLGASVYRDGVKVCNALNAKEKKFAAMNDQIIMFPDKVLIDAVEQGKADWNTSADIKKVSGKFGRVHAPGPERLVVEDYFEADSIIWKNTAVRLGGEITISNSTIDRNNKTARVIGVSGKRIMFEPYTFTSVEDQRINVTVPANTTISISRIPAQFANTSSSYLTNLKAIVSDVFDFTQTPFKAGDTVIVHGSTVAANNKAATITEVYPRMLVFGVDTFTVADDQMLSLYKPADPVEGNVHKMALSFSNADVAFMDQMESQTIVAVSNTLRSSNIYWPNTKLKVGDAITITGSAKNDGTYIIREIAGTDLRFDENVFENWPEQTQGQPLATETVAIEREIPDMDGIFVHENRLWGYKGNTIYASKLGDPTNFNVYDLLADDSWTWTMDGSGQIQGAIVYQGYPMFFKEDKVVRIYGDRPSQFRAMDVTAMGIRKGCGDSLAIAGDTLYYVSRNGLTYYSGGYSQNAHDPFGELVFSKAIAGSDGRRYFLSAWDGTRWHLFVYDTVWNSWFQEDNKRVQQFACDQGNMYLLAEHYDSMYLFLDGHAVDIPAYATIEEPVESEVLFNDFTGNYWTAGRGYGNPSRKGTSKLQLRVTLEMGAELEAWIIFDDDEANPILAGKKMVTDHKESFYLPIIPRRSDHYKIRLVGRGDWTLNSLVREEYSGSDIH